MAIKKTVEIDVEIVKAQGGLDAFTKNIQQADNATKSLKAQMIEAQREVTELSEKFGATSREAVNAAKKAAELKDRIGDAKSLTEAFNPDAKFKALSNSLTGVAGGFAAYQGALGLIGVESKETEEALLKVQSAMALASGAQAVGESVDSFKQLGAVVKSYTIVQRISTALQLAFNTAMAANPIGVIVAAIVGLIAAGYALVKMFQASSDATEASATANKKLNQELQSQINIQKKATVETDLQRDSQLKMAKASGASSKEIRKLSEELANQEVKQKIANAETLKAIFLEARRVAGLEDATDAQKETAKVAFKALQDANKLAEDAVLNRRKLAIDNRVAERQEQTDANNKTKESNKKNNDELLAQQKKHKEDAKKINEDALANNLKSSQTEFEQLEADYKAKKALLVSQKVSTEALEIEYLNKINDINLANQKIDYDVKQKAKEDNKVLNAEKIAQEDAQFLKLQEITLAKADFEKLQLVQKYEAEYILAKDNVQLQLALKEKLATDIKAIDDKEAENKRILQQQQIELTGATFGKISELAGKNSKIGKAFAVGQALINTYQGITAELQTKTVTPFEIGLKIANVATVAGIGFKAVKSILSTNPLSGGGGGASPSASGGGGGASSAPQFNLVGQSSTNQLAQTISTQQKQPIKTYVVAGDVTTQQSLDRNAVQTSTFGG